MTLVACQQLAPRVGDLEHNITLSVAAVSHAVAAGADIVVLPELVTSGYVFADQEEARGVAVDTGHPVFDAWAQAASAGPGSLVVGGFCERGEDGKLYNSLAVVDGSGVIASYRKTHLWDREKLVFTEGSAPPPVVDTSHGRLGVLICYDLEFPEMTRSLALAGADLIAVPTNWPLVERPEGERAPEVLIAMASARVNHVAIALCDRSGEERGQQWTQGTAIITEQGWVTATAAPGHSDSEGALVMAELDLSAARDKRISDHNDLLTDRRPELYAAVTSESDDQIQERHHIRRAQSAYGIT